MKTENLIYLVDSESLSVINSYSSIEEASEDTLIGIEQIKYSLDNHVKIEDSWYFCYMQDRPKSEMYNKHIEKQIDQYLQYLCSSIYVVLLVLVVIALIYMS